ncbi:Amidohydrolase 2 [Penicillium bovifimosum]|uniref:Amidohydrolase 2 n=1 Tax=Penicillium bovifimosum TaxID=126998 RepID=A0A9W9KXB1_9EURO|nr:Amidohydrolase 2 [Penicillium bovifimosum]KAJ5124166.1 Amidohydrolase 2 [Penicillium bovifimosum]
MSNFDEQDLNHVIWTQPSIDHHAHHLLNREAALNPDMTTRAPLGAIVSANYDSSDNIEQTIPVRWAMCQLHEHYESCNYRCDDFKYSWDELQARHDRFVREDYGGLIEASLKGTHVLFLDDPIPEEVEDLIPSSGYDSFTTVPTKRIAHIEGMAAAQILEMVRSEPRPDETVWSNFRQRFQNALREAMEDPKVVAFKTDICHRTGLDVDPYPSDDATLGVSLLRVLDSGTTRSGFQVNDKPLCDWLVQQTLQAISYSRREPAKPLHFETGLEPGFYFAGGEANLVRANPAFLQPLIAKYPQVPIVLLHAAYPYTREAVYLAHICNNVYLDLSVVFPKVSQGGQEKVLRECLDVLPPTRLLWSSGGREQPESYYLATYQFRKVLALVLWCYVKNLDLTIKAAGDAAVGILFGNANKLYGLGFDTPVLREFTEGIEHRANRFG